MLEKLKTEIYADGANLKSMIDFNNKDYIKGLTTNPTLMRLAGINNYNTFAKEILLHVTDKPISFEVFSDDLKEMKEQARIISSWGDNVYVKLPITNTKGEFTSEIIKELSNEGVKLNITALFTIQQLEKIINCFNPEVPSVVSIFAGRIADTGVDPLPIMKAALKLLEGSNIKLIWASPREVFNVVQASDIGCHIITVTADILKKLDKISYDLNIFSLDTVKMFYNDAKKSNYFIE